MGSPISNTGLSSSLYIRSGNAASINVSDNKALWTQCNNSKRNEYFIVIEARCGVSLQEAPSLPTTLTTPRPAWLRGAPAQPAGARETSAMPSWDPSPTTSVSVSLPLSSVCWNVVTRDLGVKGWVYFEVFAFIVQEGGEPLAAVLVSCVTGIWFCCILFLTLS